MNLPELLAVILTSTTIFGSIMKQIKKVRNGIEYQIDRITALEKNVRTIKEKGSDPMREVLSKLDRLNGD